jgi:Fibronectin type III domain
LTTSSQVTFTWQTPSNSGGTGTSILDYTIQWDNATGTFSQLTTGVTDLTFTKTGVSAGQTYQFKIAARNQVGLSVYTSSFSIIAASVPATPNAPTTAVDGA